jgi:hypothetical protein
MAVATFATIPLDLLLVPFCQARFDNGAIGGAIAFVITEAGMMAAGLLLLPRGTFGWNNVMLAARIFLAGGLMAVVTWPLRDAFILIPVVVGALIYFTLIVILRVVPKDDWSLLLSMAQSILGRFRKPKTELPL